MGFIDGVKLNQRRSQEEFNGAWGIAKYNIITT